MGDKLKPEILKDFFRCTIFGMLERQINPLVRVTASQNTHLEKIWEGLLCDHRHQIARREKLHTTVART